MTSNTSSNNVTSPALQAPKEQHSEHQAPQNPLIFDYIDPPIPTRVSIEDYVNSYGILTDHVQEEKEDHPAVKHLLELKDQRFRRYETEYKEYLLETYFTPDIIESSTRIDEETIKANRLAYARWYAGEDKEEAVGSPSVAEISADEFISKGGVVVVEKKSC